MNSEAKRRATYLKQAAEARTAARAAVDEYLRGSFLRIAEDWEALALSLEPIGRAQKSQIFAPQPSC